MAKTPSAQAGDSHPLRLDEAIKTAHEQILKAAGFVSNLMLLLGRYEHAGEGLLKVDKYRPHPDDVVEGDAGEKDGVWQEVVLGLRRHVRAAMAAWTATIDDVERHVYLAFARSTSSTATCGPLMRGSYHDIVLAIARIFLDTHDRSAVHENELGMLGELPFDDTDPAVRVCRLRLVEALKDRQWWQQAQLGLDREYAQVLADIRNSPRDPDQHLLDADLAPVDVPPRTTIDQDAERAFDLIIHYRSLLRGKRKGDSIPQVDAALPELEEVLKQWLPAAHDAGSDLLQDVIEKLGDRDSILDRLEDCDIEEHRASCLRALASSAFSPDLGAREAAAACRAEVEHWRGLLPPAERRPDGSRFVSSDAQLRASSAGNYWSSDLTRHPSYEGASLILAAACDAVVKAAVREGVPSAHLRPVIQLARSLREHPSWVIIFAPDAGAILERQEELARQVEETLIEIESCGTASIRRAPIGLSTQAEPVAKQSPDAATPSDLARNAAEPTTGLAEQASTSPTGPDLSTVEQAVALLLRDGAQPKSTRSYAKLVGVSHTTLTRNKQWKQARAISDAGTQGRLPKGSKDKDGNIEAWTEETVCENCRQEKIVATATVDGTLHHVCEDCAQKLVPRTNSNTTQRTTDGT